jgi:hypothetical protein
VTFTTIFVLVVTTLNVLGAADDAPPRIEEQVLSSMEVCEQWKEDVLSLNADPEKPHYAAKCVRRYTVEI